MNIVIVGGGLVGSTLAAKLSGDGHDVTLIEQQAPKGWSRSTTGLSVTESRISCVALLYDVTMEEPGISKVVSVRMEN